MKVKDVYSEIYCKKANLFFLCGLFNVKITEAEKKAVFLKEGENRKLFCNREFYIPK